MNPQSVASLILASSFIHCEDEGELYSFPDIIDFLKIAFYPGSVSYGHFNAILENAEPEIQEMYNMLEKSFFISHLVFSEGIQEIIKQHKVAESSPLGVVVLSNLQKLSILPFFNVPKLVSEYKSWKENLEINQLPLILKADYLFNNEPIPKLISPLPTYLNYNLSYDELEELLQKSSKNTPQSLLYLALLHALQRKSSKAIEEATLLSLKMTDSDDESTKSRAAVILSQIYNIIGMDADSSLALNESIDTAKHLADPSILSAAVALKAKVENKKELWTHAANLPNPAPEAIVRAALENGSLSDALKLDSPFLAASAYSINGGEFAAEMAATLPITPQLLPVRLLALAADAKWSEAAKLFIPLSPSDAVVRAAALAFAVLYYKVAGEEELVEVIQDDFNAVLNVSQISEDTKIILRKISQLFDVIPNLNELPTKEGLLYRLKWAFKKAIDNKVYLELAAKLASKAGAVKLYESIYQRALEITIEIQQEPPIDPIKTIEIEDLIQFLSQL